MEGSEEEESVKETVDAGEWTEGEDMGDGGGVEEGSKRVSSNGTGCIFTATKAVSKCSV